MHRIILLAIAFLLTTALSTEADDNQWQVFNFSKTTSDKVILEYGPPSLIKTEETYSDWVKNQALGGGQLNTYVMSYSIATGDLNILKGPLGMASEAEVVIDNGKVIEIVWSYNGNQQKPAFQQWMSHKGFTNSPGNKPAVVMIGTWRPKKRTIVIATCYTGGDAAVCRGPISVYYSKDIEK